VTGLCAPKFPVSSVKQGKYEAETGSPMTASTANFRSLYVSGQRAIANLLQTFPSGSNYEGPLWVVSRHRSVDGVRPLSAKSRLNGATVWIGYGHVT
jgi:hypothetical protein